MGLWSQLTAVPLHMVDNPLLLRLKHLRIFVIKKKNNLMDILPTKEKVNISFGFEYTWKVCFRLVLLLGKHNALNLEVFQLYK